MIAKSLNNSRFVFIAHVLSAEVLVERGVLASEEVFRVLKVVSLQVVDESRSHMGVVRTRADTGIEHRSSKFV